MSYVTTILSSGAVIATLSIGLHFFPESSELPSKEKSNCSQVESQKTTTVPSRNLRLRQNRRSHSQRASHARIIKSGHTRLIKYRSKHRRSKPSRLEVLTNSDSGNPFAFFFANCHGLQSNSPATRPIPTAKTANATHPVHRLASNHVRLNKVQTRKYQRQHLVLSHHIPVTKTEPDNLVAFLYNKLLKLSCTGVTIQTNSTPSSCRGKAAAVEHGNVIASK